MDNFGFQNHCLTIVNILCRYSPFFEYSESQLYKKRIANKICDFRSLDHLQNTFWDSYKVTLSMVRKKSFFRCTYGRLPNSLEEHEYYQRALDQGMFPPTCYYARNYPTKDLFQSIFEKLRIWQINASIFQNLIKYFC